MLVEPEELEEKVAEAARTKGEARSPALVKRYQRLVGALLFKSVVTGPDIAWAVAMLSRAMAWPTEALMGEAFRCLSYVVQHKSLPIKFSRDTYFSARTGTRKSLGIHGESGLCCVPQITRSGVDLNTQLIRSVRYAFLYQKRWFLDGPGNDVMSGIAGGSIAQVRAALTPSKYTVAKHLLVTSIVLLAIAAAFYQRTLTTERTSVTSSTQNI